MSRFGFLWTDEDFRAQNDGLLEGLVAPFTGEKYRTKLGGDFTDRNRAVEFPETGDVTVTVRNEATGTEYELARIRLNITGLSLPNVMGPEGPQPQYEIQNVMPDTEAFNRALTDQSFALDVAADA